MKCECRRARVGIAAVAAVVGACVAGSVVPGPSGGRAYASSWKLSQTAPVVPAQKPDLPIVKTEETPEPANLVAEKKSPETNWSARCMSNPEGQITDCRVTQNIALTKTGHRLLAVVVRIPRDTGAPAMTLNLPHGLFLPAGTQLQVDKTAPKEIVIETCDAKGCYASLDVDPELLMSLKKGSTLTVTFQNLAKQPIVVPVTLVGFTAAFAKIE